MHEDRPIIICYASAGGGHRSAALAIAEALPEAGWEGSVEVLDVLADTPAWFRALYSLGYLWAVRALPHLWEWAFDLTADITRWRPNPAPVRWLRTALTRRFRRRLVQARPAAVISTHFLSSDVIGDLVLEGHLKAWTATVLTDFLTHTFWMHEGIDALITPTHHQQTELIDVCPLIGLDPGAVHALGIPIRRAFRELPDHEQIRRRLDLRPGTPCVVIMAAKRDARAVVRTLEQLGRIEGPLDVLVISEENRRVRQAVAAYRAHPWVRVHNLGRVDYIADLFAIADVMMGKAGGLTISECLARRTPMVIFRPYKGQEERNTDAMLEGGAAVRLNQFAGMARRVAHLLADTPSRRRMKEACGRLARPDAALDVARLALEQIAARRTDEPAPTLSP